MYAIVDIAGQQIKVEKNEKIFVHLLEGDTGASVHFNRVLLIDNDKDILVGNPLLSDALITGKIISHIKGDKIKVFKKKRRKGYKVLKGHRQYYTEVQIEEIMEKGGSKILKDLETKIEAKKSLKTEKSKKAAKPSAEKAKPSSVKKTETVPETAVEAKKATKSPESKPKKSPVKTTKTKSSAAGKTSETKVKKSGTASTDKTGTKTAGKKKTTGTGTTTKKKTAGTKKTTAAKKPDDKKNNH
jgi:large subunit ribosomal protein L21